MDRTFRSSAGVAFAVTAIWAMLFLSPGPSGVRLLANTVLAMGGTGNPAGLNMERELNGYVSGAAGTAYAGYEFQAVPWSAAVLSFGFAGFSFDVSQAEGVGVLEAAIANVDAGSNVVAFGYSGSAAVITKELRALQDRRDQGLPAPSPNTLSFITIGNPNRPNGGVLSRLEGLFVPFPVEATFNGPMPQTDYQVLDISWEYDPISDMPAHPFNVVADLNAMVAYLNRHAWYFNADPTVPAAVLSDVTWGNTRYLTLKSQHLPLLEPLYSLQILNPLLDLVEPALRYVIDLAYDRTVDPGVPTPLQWKPVLRDPDKVRDGFIRALGGQETPVPPPLSSAVSAKPATSVEPASRSPQQRPRNAQRSVAERSLGHPRATGRRAMRLSADAA